LVRRLGGPQSRSGLDGDVENSQPLPALEPPIIQPIVQRYTTELSRILVLKERTFDFNLEISFKGWDFFSSPPRQDWFWDSSSLLSYGYQKLFPPGAKRPGLEANHPPPSSSEAKNRWRYTSTLQCIF
jgi:hypothetical protein